MIMSLIKTDQSIDRDHNFLNVLYYLNFCAKCKKKILLSFDPHRTYMRDATDELFLSVRHRIFRTFL